MTNPAIPMVTICDTAWAKIAPTLGDNAEQQKETFIDKCLDNATQSQDLKQEEQCFLILNEKYRDYMTLEDSLVCLQRFAFEKEWVTKPRRTEFSPGFMRLRGNAHQRGYISFGIGTGLSGSSELLRGPEINYPSINSRVTVGFFIPIEELGHDTAGTAWAYRLNLALAFENDTHIKDGDSAYDIFSFGARWAMDFVAQLSGWRLVMAPEVAFYLGAWATHKDLDVGIEDKLYHGKTPIFMYRIQAGLKLGAEFPTLLSAEEKTVLFFMIGGGVNILDGYDKVTNTPIDESTGKPQDIEIKPEQVTGEAHLDFGIHF